MKATWELTSIARRASGVSSAEPCLARSAVQCWPSLRSLNLIVTAVHAKDTILSIAQMPRIDFDGLG